MSEWNCLAKWLFSAVVVILSTGPIVAQVQAGRIVGMVTDPNQALVVKAEVQALQLTTSQVKILHTSGTGEFVFTPLEPGVYNVTVTAPGFEATKVNNVEVIVGQAARVNVQLQIGQASTKIEVTAAAQLVNTESGTLGQEISNKQVVDLPLNGRNFYQLLSLTPGATALPPTGNTIPIRANNENGTAISGVRGNMTSFYLDGVDVTDHHQGGTLIQTSIDALQEFQVQQSEYTAEFRNAGPVVNASTKSGSSSFHGGAYEFLRNNDLDARNFFALTREPLRRNQFGVNIGGPLTIPKLYHSRNRTFFFGDYEGNRQQAGQVFNNIVPTTAMRNGDFSAPGLNILYTPVTHAPVAGNIIPASQISPQATFFNSFIPLPNSGTNRAIFNPLQTINQDQFTARVDQVIGDKNRIFVRWSFIRYNESNPNAFPALGFTPMSSQGQNVVAAWISDLKPTLVNEARFSYMPNSLNLKAFMQGTDFYSKANISGFEDTGHRPGDLGSFPDFAWSGYASMSGSTFDQRPKTQDLKSWELYESLTWIKGRHIFKFGAQIRDWLPLFTDSGTYEGQWTFNGSLTQNPSKPAGTGDAYADYLFGVPFSVGRSFPANTFGGKAVFWHFFAQDDFKVTNRLTVNLGIRYEYSPWLTGYQGQVGTFLPGAAKPIAVGAVNLNAQYAAPTAYALFGNLIQSCPQAGLPASCTFNDDAQWGPRIGFAWTPASNGNTVIRGGYGIFYEPESSGNRVNHNMVPYQLNETVFNSGNRAMANYFLGNPIGAAGTTPSLAGGLPHMAQGYDQHWSFGVQQKTGFNSVLEVDYVGNRGVNLYGPNPINDPLAGPGAIQGRRPFPLFGAITYNAQDTSSIYHALQVKFDKRTSGGLWYLLSYTYSKSFTAANTPVAGGDYYYQRALSSFNIPQNFTFSVGYELPVGKGRRFVSNANRLVDSLVGGWQAQSILVLHTGLPFTPTVSRDIANVGLGSQLPNCIGNPVPANQTISNWFNKAAFALPANFTYGNCDSYILQAGFAKNLDLSLFKQFHLGEWGQLQFRSEAFNLTNTSTFAAPGTNVDTSSGGVVTSTISNPRNLQFALKLTF